MNSKCSECNEDFERETGFYVGAMYASYALTIAYGVGLFLLLVLLLDYTAITFLIVFTITLILLLPWLYRTSRLFWINLFVRKRTNDRTAKKS
jgi:membrane protein implicated in regulation of membrane protease activity